MWSTVNYKKRDFRGLQIGVQCSNKVGIKHVERENLGILKGGGKKTVHVVFEEERLRINP